MTLGHTAADVAAKIGPQIAAEIVASGGEVPTDQHLTELATQAVQSYIVSHNVQGSIGAIATVIIPLAVSEAKKGIYAGLAKRQQRANQSAQTSTDAGPTGNPPPSGLPMAAPPTGSGAGSTEPSSGTPTP
jgi:NADH dehydrogenase/NADH:ubiquinone oxidoreductase subunit G